MRKSFLFTIPAALLAALMYSSACNDADDLIDCAKICNRYEDCVDDDYDVSECVDRCEDFADRNPGSADACESCIDDRSCIESVFQCGGQCAGIVP